jgi:hypothetical protein
MTPTPRTDAAWEDALRLPGGGFTCKPNMTGLAMEMSKFARQLERENQTFRAAQKACEDCDAPRVDRIAELERDLAAERALADRLAHWLSEMADEFILPAELENGANSALAAWKEARNDT